MSYRTFNHLFLPLMVLSAISAFFIPVQYTNVFRGRVDGLFSPVATPLRRLVETTSARFGFDNNQDKDLLLHSANLTDASREIDRIIEANPCQAEQYRSGKHGLLGFFVGQVMKETKGQADPRVVNDRVREKLA